MKQFDEVSDVTSITERKDDTIDQRWNYKPDLDAQVPPYYQWPPNVKSIFIRMLNAWSLLDVRVYVLALSILIWHLLSPSLERCREFSVGWMAEIWLRNFIVILLVAGGLHLYFYTFKKQQNIEKYDHRELSHRSANFHFGSQLLDNMFWVLTSTVGFLSIYESLMMWSYANGIGTLTTFDESPIWFSLLLLLIPAWTGFHFYWQHRMFHIPLFYKMGHDWHHKNVNVGPWSGAAVHPIENLVWFSAVLILLALPSHPIHAIFLLQLQVITAITTHCGFENLHLKRAGKFKLGDFYHQLHHRFYDCNYGTIASPWDYLFNTYYDGSSNSNDWLRLRRKKLNEPNP